MERTQRWIGDRGKITAILAFIAITQSLLLVGVTDAKDVDLVIAQTVNSYISIAFPTSGKSLVKFDTQGPIQASFVCEGLTAEQCTLNANAMRESVHVNGNLEFDFSKQESQIRFVFGQNDFIGRKSSELSLQYHDGIIDISDPKCQVFIGVKGSAIQSADILISDEQPVLRKKICLFVQLSTALGLHIFGNLKFTDQWKAIPGGLDQVTDENFRNQIKRVVAIEYIHMCELLRPGMLADETRTILSTSISCLTPFVGK